MSRFSARYLNPRTSNLVIGTSRTKYIRSGQVGAAIHSYRGAALSELCNLVAQYPQWQLFRVVIAEFNDHRDSAVNFIDNWKLLVHLICIQFNISVLIILKTFATSNSIFVNKKIRQLY